MSNQILISSGAKLRDLDDVIIGTDGVLSSLGFNVANGVPKLDENGKILVSQLPNSVMEFKGVWNAATNTPTLANGTGNAGDVYLCNVAGTVNFGAGPITFAVGDYAVYTGSVWARSSGAVGTVTSVAVSRDGDALAITGSPITSSGTINIGFTGNSTQYINGAGNLVTFPTIISEAQNLVTEVYNETGATLTKGTIVYINGGHGNLPTVTKAIATSDATSAQTYGVVRADITNMNNGYVTVIGSLSDLDTSAYTAGTQLYLSGTTAGAWTSTKPQAPVHLVYVGIVVRSHPTQGVVEIRIQNGYELEELHNVQIISPANGNILQYDSASSLWKNVAGTTTNIAEGTNLYFTNARARNAISLTTLGSTGAATYDSATGILNIPNYVDQYVGTVTSVGLSAPTGFSVSGSPVTSSGTLALSFASGYSLPTTLKQSNWDDAYTWVAAFPTQTGNAGKFLTTDGSTLSWAANPLGTVTSVAMTVPTGLSVAGSPITTSGTLAVTFAAGYSIPTNASQTNWDTAYTNRITSATSPLSISSNVISISQASSTTNGYLSSTDWTTFNSKQNALTNPVTGTGTNNYFPKFTSTGSTIGDSILYQTSNYLIQISANSNNAAGLSVGNTSTGIAAQSYVTLNTDAGYFNMGKINSNFTPPAWLEQKDAYFYNSAYGNIVVYNDSGKIYLRSNGNTSTPDVTITNNKIGILNTNPSSQISIGTITGGDGTTTPMNISLGSTFGTNALGTNFKLKLFEDVAGAIYGLGISSNLLEITSGAGGAISFFTGGSNRRMTITNSGNFGFNTATPSTFSGYVNVTIKGSSTGGNLDFVNASDVRKAYVVSDDNGMYVGTFANIPVELRVNDTRAVKVDTSKRLIVGGSSDTSPSTTQAGTIWGTGSIVSYATGSFTNDGDDFGAVNLGARMTADGTFFGVINKNGYQTFAINIENSSTSTARGGTYFYSKTSGTWYLAMKLESNVVTIGGSAGVSGGGTLQVMGDVNITGNFKINGTTIGGGGGSGVTGSGTTNYITKWSSSSSLTNSLIYDNGSSVIIGGTTSFNSGKFEIKGSGIWDGAVITLTNTGTSGQSFSIFSTNSSFSQGGDRLLFYNGTNDRNLGVILANGQWGIGTVTPATNVKLTLENSDVCLQLNGTTAAGYTQMRFNGTGRVYQTGVGNASETALNVANSWYVFDGGATAMRLVLRSNGNLLVGTNPTDNGLGKVQIYGNLYVSGSAVYAGGVTYSSTQTFNGLVYLNSTTYVGTYQNIIWSGVSSSYDFQMGNGGYGMYILSSAAIDLNAAIVQRYGVGYSFAGNGSSAYNVLLLNSGTSIDEITVLGGVRLTTTTAGLIPPRMTTTQLNALSARGATYCPNGTTVFDTTINILRTWNGSAWMNLW